MSIDEAASKLYATPDAVLWGSTFCRLFDGFVIRRGEHVEDNVADMGLMVGWFSNALETGRSAGRSEGILKLRRIREVFAESEHDWARYPTRESLTAGIRRILED